MSSAILICTIVSTVNSAGSHSGEFWCPTGIYAADDMIITLKYKDNDKWTCKEGQLDLVKADGHDDSVPADNFLLPHMPLGCCVAQFRNIDTKSQPPKSTGSKVFYVGLGAIFTAQTGQLYLACNDNPEGFKSHKGKISMDIQVYEK
jgi:hypothetical protein